MDNVKLPVISVLKAAFKTPFEQPSVYLGALFIAGFCMVLLDIINIYYFEDAGVPATVLYTLIYAVVATVFTITAHRIILLGPDSVPNHGVLSWSKRESKFLGWTMALYAFFILVIVLVSRLAAWADHSIFIFPLFPISIVLAAYLFGRLCVLFPATAIEEKMSLSSALNLTAGNGWRLVFIVAVLPILFGIVFSWLGNLGIFIELLVSIIWTLVFLIEIAALSLSYRFLVSKRRDL